MVLPMSNWAPVLVVDVVGAEVAGEPLGGAVPLLPLCAQPANPNTATAAPATRYVRMWLAPDVADAVGHPELAPAGPDDRVAVLEEHRLVGAIDRDVVNDVVGDHRMARSLHRYRPARPERVDGVPGPDHYQR